MRLLYDDDQPFVGSFALFRRLRGSEEEWLLVDDGQSGMLRLIESERKAPDTFRSCLFSAIESELGLSRKSDFIISGLSRAHHQAPVEWPDTQRVKWVVVQFFPVDAYGPAPEQQLAERPNLQWISMAEVAAGRSHSGMPICPRQRLLIERADILPPHIRV